jgi:hypothetical protein
VIAQHSLDECAGDSSSQHAHPFFLHPPLLISPVAAWLSTSTLASPSPSAESAPARSPPRDGPPSSSPCRAERDPRPRQHACGCEQAFLSGPERFRPQSSLLASLSDCVACATLRWTPVSSSDVSSFCFSSSLACSLPRVPVHCLGLAQHARHRVWPRPGGSCRCTRIGAH